MNLDENAWISGIRHQASPTAADVTVYLLTVEHQGSTLPQQQLDERPENQKPGNSQTCEREFVNREKKRRKRNISSHTWFLFNLATLSIPLYLLGFQWSSCDCYSLVVETSEERPALAFVACQQKGAVQIRKRSRTRRFQLPQPIIPL